MADSCFYLELFSADEDNTLSDPMNDGPTYPGFLHLSFKVNDVGGKFFEIFPLEITLIPLDFDTFISEWHTAWLKDLEGRIVEVTYGFDDK